MSKRSGKELIRRIKPMLDRSGILSARVEMSIGSPAILIVEYVVDDELLDAIADKGNSIETVKDNE